MRFVKNRQHPKNRYKIDQKHNSNSNSKNKMFKKGSYNVKKTEKKILYRAETLYLYRAKTLYFYKPKTLYNDTKEKKEKSF